MIKILKNFLFILSKGDLIYLEGSIKTRSWKDKNNETKKTTEVVATQFMSLEKRSKV